MKKIKDRCDCLIPQYVDGSLPMRSQFILLFMSYEKDKTKLQ